MTHFPPAINFQNIEEIEDSICEFFASKMRTGITMVSWHWLKDGSRSPIGRPLLWGLMVLCFVVNVNGVYLRITTFLWDQVTVLEHPWHQDQGPIQKKQFWQHSGSSSPWKLLWTRFRSSLHGGLPGMGELGKCIYANGGYFECYRIVLN